MSIRSLLKEYRSVHYKQEYFRWKKEVDGQVIWIDDSNGRFKKMDALRIKHKCKINSNLII